MSENWIGEGDQTMPLDLGPLLTADQVASNDVAYDVMRKVQAALAAKDATITKLRALVRELWIRHIYVGEAVQAEAMWNQSETKRKLEQL